MRKIKITPLLALALALGLTACTPQGPSAVTPPVPTPTVAPTPTATPSASSSPVPAELVWSAQLFQQDYTAQDGTTIMEVTYSFPDIQNYELDPAWEKIHSYFSAEGDAYLANAGELAGFAADDYLVTKATGGEFLPFAEDASFRFSYQTEDLVSVVRSYYANSVTGAAHPANYQFSEQFDLSTGDKLLLSNFFTDPAAARTRILELLAEKAAPVYSLDALTQEFQDEYFYLTETGFVFYYQPDTLAPYAAGLLEFSIPYADLADFLSWELSAQPQSF